MTGYDQYIDDVESGVIVTNNYIKLAVQRFRDFQNRDDMYFDAEKVKSVIDFIQLIKMYEGEKAHQSFKVENWQQFAICNIWGWFYKENNKRVTRDALIFISRKMGKSSFGAALALNQLLNDGENSPSVIFAANSAKQAHLIFEKSVEFAKSLDPNCANKKGKKGKYLQIYRNEIKSKFNIGKLQVVSTDTSSIEGQGASTYILDEFHQAVDNKVLTSLKYGQGARKNPLGIIITTAGSNLNSPCKQLYDTSCEILTGVKTSDKTFSLIFGLEDGDEWDDYSKLEKANPNINVTVSKSDLIAQIEEAKNNSSLESEVKTKVLNLWVSSSDVWLTHSLLLKNSQNINIDDFKGQKCWVGVDLAAVSDLTAVSIMWMKDEKYYFKTNYYLPQSALTEHQQKSYYQKVFNQGDLKITAGNVTDYDDITTDLLKLKQVCTVMCVYYDSWNATSWASTATEKGLNLEIYSQKLANFNRPTKEFERLLKSDKIILDNNELTRFCFGNVMLKYDQNENCKPVKANNKSKIDGVIAILSALGGYLQTPSVNTKVYSF